MSDRKHPFNATCYYQPNMICGKYHPPSLLTTRDMHKKVFSVVLCLAAFVLFRLCPGWFFRGGKISISSDRLSNYEISYTLCDIHENEPTLKKHNSTTDRAYIWCCKKFPNQQKLNSKDMIVKRRKSKRFTLHPPPLSLNRIFIIIQSPRHSFFML